MDKSKIADIGRQAGIAAALAAAAGTDSSDGAGNDSGTNASCTCPKCGYEGDASDFAPSDDGVGADDDNNQGS